MESPGNERSWKTKEVQRLLWAVPSFLSYPAKEDPGGTAKEQMENKEKGWVNAVRRGAQGDKVAAASSADSASWEMRAEKEGITQVHNPTQENTLCVALLDKDKQIPRTVIITFNRIINYSEQIHSLLLHALKYCLHYQLLHI